MGEPELYRILGLSPGASVADLKSAYRRLVKTYHPDSQGGKGNAQAFSRIVQAYQSLEKERRGVGARPEAGGVSRQGRRPVKPSGEPGRREPPGAEPLDLFSHGRTLLMGRDPLARAAAARALGSSGRKSSYAFLRKALWDADERVLVSVVRAIGVLDIRQCEGELGSLFSKAGPAVRKEILAAVGMIGTAHGFEGLVRIGLRDPDPAVREQAARALAGRGR